MDALLHLMSQLASAAQLQAFLQVFLTDKEREMLMERLLIFRELAQGASQREVAATLGCSVVTVTRGAKAYRMHKPQIDAWLETVGDELWPEEPVV